MSSGHQLTDRSILNFDLKSKADNRILSSKVISHNPHIKHFFKIVSENK